MIRAHALHLFTTQGYDATTVQQIINDVEVSESTFFRYFPTKGDVVLTDDFDPVIVAAFQLQPPELSPIQALRGAFHEAFGTLSSEQVAGQSARMRLVLAVPELRAAMMDQFTSAMRLLAEVLAERTGRPPDDMAVLTLAGAVVGAAMAVMLVMLDDPKTDLSVVFDEAMGHLEGGLRL
ncbi:MAG: TetR family transcriptional regulator [Candidatus Dormibacteraeota bacterium]|nr:TetR family transcriptional regulator [Candidatus Dormibacteraeota bacterium]